MSHARPLARSARAALAASATSTRLTRAEAGLLLAVLALFLGAIALPPLAQDPSYHRFADSRFLLGVPNALDVLSNLGFLAGGVWGLAQVVRDRLFFFSPALKPCATVAFAGFVLTAAGSACYHLAPSDAGLVLDRLGMVVVFAALLGMAAVQRISDRAGVCLLVLALALGPVCVSIWQSHGNLTPYAVMQYGGIALLLAMLAAPARGPGPNWTALIATYALAKGFEATDAAVFELTGHLVSGHTLKHLTAALAVVAIAAALDVRRWRP